MLLSLTECRMPTTPTTTTSPTTTTTTSYLRIKGAAISKAGMLLHKIFRKRMNFFFKNHKLARDT